MPDHPFRELDELVLHLKGLILIRDLRQRVGAETDEIDMFSDEITRARDRLADFVRHGELAQAA